MAEKRSVSEEKSEDGTKKLKLTFGFSKNGHQNTYAKKNVVKPGISIKFGGQKPTSAPPPLKPKSSTVAAIFNADDDDEPEEMPPEAKMRMRNIGRDTPTSAGPNSFGKTKQGFCDVKKMYEKQLKHALETNDNIPVEKNEEKVNQ